MEGRVTKLVARLDEFIEKQNAMNTTLSAILMAVEDLRAELRQWRCERSPPTVASPPAVAQTKASPPPAPSPAVKAPEPVAQPQAPPTPFPAPPIASPAPASAPSKHEKRKHKHISILFLTFSQKKPSSKNTSNIAATIFSFNQGELTRVIKHHHGPTLTPTVQSPSAPLPLPLPPEPPPLPPQPPPLPPRRTPSPRPPQPSSTRTDRHHRTRHSHARTASPCVGDASVGLSELKLHEIVPHLADFDLREPLVQNTVHFCWCFLVLCLLLLILDIGVERARKKKEGD